MRYQTVVLKTPQTNPKLPGFQRFPLRQQFHLNFSLEPKQYTPHSQLIQFPVAGTHGECMQEEQAQQ